MHALQLQAFRDELTKVALLERLVRIGATDVPGTPRLLMRRRTPQELAALQTAVTKGWDARVTKPIMQVAGRGLAKLPEGRIRGLATQAAQAVAQDPVGIAATSALPIPGAGAAWIAAKRGAERVLDRVAPMQAT